MVESAIIEHLEIALIELEYAGADVTENLKTGRSASQRDLAEFLARVRAANEAIHLALEALSDGSAPATSVPEPASEGC